MTNLMPLDDFPTLKSILDKWTDAAKWRDLITEALS
jgi:hypothetical protein